MPSLALAGTVSYPESQEAPYLHRKSAGSSPSVAHALGVTLTAVPFPFGS